MPIDNVKTTSICPIEKFKNYVFHETQNRGKKKLFEDWGYDIMDSKCLQAEFERQAQAKYANGDFELGLLNQYGQRLSIQITLPRKDQVGTITFISGWMVYPDGVIRLNTPYGGTV